MGGNRAGGRRNRAGGGGYRAPAERIVDVTETATPKRRRTGTQPDAPEVSPESAPDKTPHPAPRTKDAPRTSRNLRVARQARRKPTARMDDNPLREGLRLERVPDPC